MATAMPTNVERLNMIILFTCTTNTGARSTSKPSVRHELTLSVKALPNEKLEADVMPNPSNSLFNLWIKGDNKNYIALGLQIFGRVVEKYEKVNTNTVLRIGRGLRGGSYFIEIVQNQQRKIL